MTSGQLIALIAFCALVGLPIGAGLVYDTIRPGDFWPMAQVVFGVVLAVGSGAVAVLSLMGLDEAKEVDRTYRRYDP